ncbi:MAG TPA: TetR family transcriptional regulator, partial [Paenibacillaceae bacterium]|nr:TetR family transcriptional regulator [Paenibacillaceae bacterium]
MFSKFFNLETEKQERIINAALKEFAQKGYEKASTNEIVKEARISKGLLFHYFKTKKDLFLFLYDFCIEILLNEFFRKIDVMEKDILIRLRQMTLLKFDLIRKHPEMFDFLMVAYGEDSDDIKKELDE